jgi:hypothetical protein
VRRPWVKLRVLRVKQEGAMARSLRALVVLVGVLVMVVAPAARAQGTLAVEIGKKAALVNGGQAVDVKVMVTCPGRCGGIGGVPVRDPGGQPDDFAFFQPSATGRRTRSWCGPRQSTLCFIVVRRVQAAMCC